MSKQLKAVSKVYCLNVLADGFPKYTSLFADRNTAETEAERLAEIRVNALNISQKEIEMMRKKFKWHDNYIIVSDEKTFNTVIVEIAETDVFGMA